MWEVIKSKRKSTNKGLGVNLVGVIGIGSAAWPSLEVEEEEEEEEEDDDGREYGYDELIQPITGACGDCTNEIGVRYRFGEEFRIDSDAYKGYG